MKQFACYLSGQTVIYSDHKPLTFMSELSSWNSKLLRWFLELARYNLFVKYIQGFNNCVDDFLRKPGLLSSSRDEDNTCERQLLNSDGNFTSFNVNYSRDSQISYIRLYIIYLLSLNFVALVHY